MKIYEPIAISLFTVLVLAASFSVGKSIGFEEGVSYAKKNSVDIVQLDSTQGVVR